MQFKSVGCVLILRSEPVRELGTPAKRFDGEICLGSAPTLRAISIYRQIGKAGTFRMCCLRVRVSLDAPITTRIGRANNSATNFVVLLIKTITAIILNKNLSSVQLRYYPPLNRIISSIGRAFLLIVLKLNNSSQTITATQRQDSVEVSTL